MYIINFIRISSKQTLTRTVDNMRSIRYRRTHKSSAVAERPRDVPCYL